MKLPGDSTLENIHLRVARPSDDLLAVAQLEGLGYMPVKAFNPYWDKNGKTFEDPDGYRVVLQNAIWAE
jgi:hypothetical protein